MQTQIRQNKPLSGNTAVYKKSYLQEKVMRNLCFASGILVAVVVVSIMYFIGSQGIKVFNDITVTGFFTIDYWLPPEGEFGALAMIRGTLILTALATLLGGTLGVMGAVFMSKIAPKPVRSLLRASVDLFVGIPSVVYGFIGLTIIVPIIRNFFPDSAGFGFLPAALILAVMILPTVISISEDSIRSVERSIEEASYALGATRWQTIRHIIIPNAAPGILAAIILGMARAIGETMAVQMVIGNTPQLTNSLVTPTSVLTTAIVMDMGNTEFGSTWSNALFMMATILLIISMLLILIVRYISKRQVLLK
jgi:phosphate transport system permease protein